MKKKILGYYNYTVILTYLGMDLAFCGILQAIGQNFWTSLVFLMLSGLCDMFDGAVAATKERDVSEKRFGIQIDSLSDLISFGVLPAVFVYMLSDKNFYVGIVATLYVLCALIRLAYFNVLEEERQAVTTESRKSYLGLPVTSIALLLPAVYLFYDFTALKGKLGFTVLLILVAAGFVSTVEIKKPKIIGKIVLLLVGVMEALALVFFVGWGAV